MKQIRHLLATALAILLSMPLMAQQTEVFIYSPGENAGLHIARHHADGWHEVGRLCSSDYGTWGA
jgi:hypothetical protein